MRKKNNKVKIEPKERPITIYESEFVDFVKTIKQRKIKEG